MNGTGWYTGWYTGCLPPVNVTRKIVAWKVTGWYIVSTRGLIAEHPLAIFDDLAHMLS